MPPSDGRKRPKRDLVPGFAKMITKRREELGLSRQQVADAAGIGMTSLCCIEREWRTPSLRVASALATALELDVPLAAPVQKKQKAATA